jgi:hypothetical protein
MNKAGQPLSGCQEKQIVYNMLWLGEARSTQNRYMQIGYGSLRGPSVFFFPRDTNRFPIEKILVWFRSALASLPSICSDSSCCCQEVTQTVVLNSLLY